VRERLRRWHTRIIVSSVVSLHDLTEPELILHDLFRRGEPADVRSGDAAADLTDAASQWGSARQVRGEVIAAMLLEDTASTPGIPRLLARGFRVTGYLDLSNARVDYPVRFQFCVFDNGVSLMEAKTRSVRILDCELPSLDANSTFVDGHLEVTGSCLSWLSLYRTQVSGHVELSGAAFSQPGETAINGDYLEVGAALYGHDLTCRGAVRLPGARIGGTLEFDGAHLTSEGDWALVADMITVGGDMRCRDGFRAIGTVGLASARIGGRLFLGGDAPPGHIGPGGPRQARGPGSISGPVDLRHAKLGGLNDEPANWPQRLHLDGLCYDDLVPSLPAQRRLQWIARDPAGYQPQPYEQLAACYRSLGEDENARHVLLAKQRERRATLTPPGKVWGVIQDGAVGYGYRPWLASLWLIALIITGTLYFAVYPAAASGTSNGRFDPFTFTLSAIVPVIGQNQTVGWILNGSQQAVLYTLTISAWILLTAFAAGLTRMMSRS
jgi:hypothetical protein